MQSVAHRLSRRTAEFADKLPELCFIHRKDL